MTDATTGHPDDAVFAVHATPAGTWILWGALATLAASLVVGGGVPALEGAGGILAGGALVLAGAHLWLGSPVARWVVGLFHIAMGGLLLRVLLRSMGAADFPRAGDLGHLALALAGLVFGFGLLASEAVTAGLAARRARRSGVAAAVLKALWWTFAAVALWQLFTDAWALLDAT